ncbi:predicted protein [Naegleria gruberi]|uniref:Predicted protein n=1 Tax=Naegleria gruberi TaxID=5762 RepID=D2VNQ3_NAEGR|nr:uncharacterized protein NAEGRDRAFT_70580 [Naegleria gruberi]EFC41448.1 predicted protein [Naegleria gruberi]|eukprot:XP_002674192.1 predicted protein [Naegleria gruberi strain NEG-M]
MISNTLNESLDHQLNNNQLTNSITRQHTTDQIAIEKASIPTESTKQLSPKQKRFISLLRFTTSNSFSTVFYIIIILFHLVLWLICGGIDLATPGRKLFLADGKLLDPQFGCILGLGSIVVVAGQCVVYLVIELIVLGLCFYSDRDTWKIKKETIICAIFQLISCVLFAVLGNIDIVKYLVDNLVPYGNVLVAYSLFAIFVSVVLPIFYSIREDRKKILDLESNVAGDVEQFLKNKENYEKILDFARRSYCPENLLCWRDIQRFKNSFHMNGKVEESARMGINIVESYLKSCSLAQINLPSDLALKVGEIETLLSNSPNLINQNLFDSIQSHCLVDIQCDVYIRFTVQSKGTKKNQKEETSTQI